MPYFRCGSCGVTLYSAAAYSTSRVCPNCSAGLTADDRIELSLEAGPRTRRFVASRSTEADAEVESAFGRGAS